MMDFTDPVLYIKWTAIFLFIMTILMLTVLKKLTEKQKKITFFLIVAVVMLSTVYLGIHTVYKNVTSVTKGPIHWHADYEVWACGERLDLINPRGLNNKIGTPLFHEHNDDRMHVEGVVSTYSDIDLGSWFEVIGGSLTPTTFSYNVEGKGLQTYNVGEKCPNGDTIAINVFVNGKKIENPENYVLYHHALVPPGDCIIVQIGEDTPGTSKMCESWSVKGWDYQNYIEKREGGDE